MPVLSPHRSSASALAGSYRSTFSTSGLDRPYFSSAGYSPRMSSYSERFTTRTYTDADGRRIYSRSGSITEDGVTTRFREESREKSVRRDSLSRDSGIGSIRENSISDYGSSRRDSSLSRSDSSRLSAINVLDSVAELRNKYSPANYVPACMRKNDNISRSKSINDIGLPPIEAKTSDRSTIVGKKKPNQVINELGVTSYYNNSCVSNSNNTNNDNGHNGDKNGNNTPTSSRASVADLCKKFNDRPYRSSRTQPVLEIEGGSKISENAFKKQDGKSGGVAKRSVTSSLLNGQSATSQEQRNGSRELTNGTTELDHVMQNGGSRSTSDVTGVDLLEEEPMEAQTLTNHVRSSSRVNNFASYIPSKVVYGHTHEINGSDDIDKGDDDVETFDACANDIEATTTASAKAVQVKESSSRSTLSPSTSSSLNSRRSVSGGGSGNYEVDGIVAGGYESKYCSPSLNSNCGVVANLNSSGGVKILGLNGLKNIGNTCFMNSVIQCLSNTKILLEYLLKDKYVADINTTISSMKGALIRAFAEVIKEVWSEDSTDRVVNTTSLKGQIQRFAPRFIGYSQQDAQEFLRYLLEGLHEDVNRVVEKPKPILTEIDDKLSDNEKAAESWSRYLRMDNSKIVDYFVGQLKSTLKCTHCGHCSVTFDPFWDLSLPIPQRAGQVRLSQCLDSFTREETLDGDEKPTCSKCKERRKCTKSFAIQKFPKILVIHLKRFSLAERFRGKLSVTVDFPLEGLDMNHYAADNVTPCRYNLYAISNHSGTTYSGHYTAYCRHPYAKSWHEYNDSRVSPISSRSIVSGEAYVLFYEQEGQRSHL